jgi:NADH-quinone oxidoreductase subunit N
MPATRLDLLIILPHVILAAGTVIVLIAVAVTRRHAAVLSLAGLTLTCSLLSLGVVMPRLPAFCTDLLVLDGLSAFSTGLVLFAALCIIILVHPYFKNQTLPAGEFTVLLMLATLGGLVLIASAHFASLVLGVELIGIPLVVMAAYIRRRPAGIEAGFKYLVLSGFSSAILLFGIALLYAGSGSLLFAPVVASFRHLSAQTPTYYLGMVLLTAGLSFKLGLVPFHMWVPDVYEGAPAPVTIFAATVSKAAVITVLLRLFPPPIIENDRYLFILFATLAIASMTLGNLLALRQQSVKRMLAYSTIAHNGYLLVAFLSGGLLAQTAVLLYVFFTVVTNLAAFGVVSLLSGEEADADDLDGYRGLAWRRPGIALVLSAAILSLLGIPLFAGFIAKFSLVAAGMASMHLVPVLALVINTGVSAYYYLRIVMTMFLGADEVPAGPDAPASRRLPVPGTIAVTVAAGSMVLVGIMPQYLIDLIQKLLDISLTG